MRKLAETNFKYRGCEDHFSRNILLFNNNMEHVNLRMTFGACKDFDYDVKDIRGLNSV